MMNGSCSGDPQVREQRDEHPAVQRVAAPLLAAELHGRLHLVAAVRRREGNRDARAPAQHLHARGARLRGGCCSWT